LLPDERPLWRLGDLECVMVSCCAGAELQVRRFRDDSSADILLRELYPSKSDLYERARLLETEYQLGDVADEFVAKNEKHEGSR
jgi:hypothetical protein